MDIIAYRETNGGFKSVDDLNNVSGIGDKRWKVSDHMSRLIRLPCQPIHFAVLAVLTYFASSLFSLLTMSLLSLLLAVLGFGKERWSSSKRYRF